LDARTKSSFQNQPPHHTLNGFRNVNADFDPAGLRDYLLFFFRRLRSSFKQAPTSLPIIPNNELLHNQHTICWIGHSTLLVKINGVYFLTDPHFSQRASPFLFAGPKRYTPPARNRQSLPAIDFVLISHNHFDHLDKATVNVLAEKGARFFVPLKVKAWFEKRGIQNVTELDWWDEIKYRGFTVTCVPAQHFSGRSLRDRNRTLWAGWVVSSPEKRFYFAGDSGYFNGFQEIGERLGPFDLAALPIGAYQPRSIMQPVHLDPDEAVQAFLHLRARRLVGIHWGTFVLSDEPPFEPPQRVLAAAAAHQLDEQAIWILKPGESRAW
jgi:L-ascorbate metabolism protein UlaG (beta-lactamase superfamily)